jgi:hypothetical protein
MESNKVPSTPAVKKDVFFTEKINRMFGDLKSFTK